MSIPTAHIKVKTQNVIAKTVLMPGDPLRAKFIADNFLTDTIQFNNVRGMLGFTGNYRGREISVMGSGMGMPSIGIYSYELYKFYNVENIIRVGSAGAYTDELDIFDIVLVQDAWSESTFGKIQNGYTEDVMSATPELLENMEKAAQQLDIKYKTTRIHSSDVFYSENFEGFNEIREKHGCAAVEMESFALFANARSLKKNAAAILTISDSLVTSKNIDSEKRQNSFTDMMKIALETGIRK
jgi:purine-nucleoside phosphorylase